jgi:LIVCS family branched-chain amino acid:cation transporter
MKNLINLMRYVKMKHFKYSLLLGMTIFAIMFGAGNVILPPSVGYFAGENYFVAILAFILTSAGFAALGVWSMALQKNNFLDITKKIHPKTHLYLLSMVVLILGPVFAAPRTAIITNQLFTAELFGGNFVVFAVSSFIFFFITCSILLSKSNLIDVIGKYLTPVLIGLLTILIGGALVQESKFVATSVLPSKSFIKGLQTGYLTVDALGYVIIATISIKAILSEKSMKHKDKAKVLNRSVLIALFLISLVYLGLGYMGATTTYLADTMEPAGIDILKHNIFEIFGKVGNIIFGLAVALACLTTSIGLIANSSNFFSVNTKSDQNKWIIGMCVFSFLVSLFPLGKITSFIGPVLLMLVPPSMCVVLLGYVNRKIRKRRTLVVPFLLSVVCGFLSLAAEFNVEVKTFLEYLPLGSFGLSWIPIVISAIVGMMAYEVFTENKSVYEDYTDEYRALKATE